MNPISDKTILLASKSPRRRDIISNLGLSYQIVEADVDEVIPPNFPIKEVPEYLANLKSEIPIDLQENEILLTADTIVILNDEIIGKPKDRAHAEQILRNLSNNQHEVISGVCLRSNLKKVSFSVTTTIHFYPLKEEEIQYYLDNYEVMDKAGAYAIQEWIGLVGIQGIQGDYYNVVGLPISRVLQELKEF